MSHAMRAGEAATATIGGGSSASSTAAPQLSVIVVHWRAEADLALLLAALPDDERFEVLVVDNGSSRLPPLGRARLVHGGANLGFGGGADLGAAVARAPLLLVLNPDVCPQPGALEAQASLPSQIAAAIRRASPDGR